MQDAEMSPPKDQGDTPRLGLGLSGVLDRLNTFDVAEGFSAEWMFDRARLDEDRPS